MIKIQHGTEKFLVLANHRKLAEVKITQHDLNEILTSFVSSIPKNEIKNDETFLLIDKDRKVALEIIVNTTKRYMKVASVICKNNIYTKKGFSIEEI